MSSKILVFQDSHIADRPPLGRVEGYRDQIGVKLVEIGQIARQVQADVVIGVGDTFHVKRPNFVSHYLVGMLQDAFRDYPCDVWLVPGNHDLGTATDEEGLMRQPISNLVGGNVYMAGATKVIKLPDTVILFRPYSAERDCDPAYYKLTDDELTVAEHMPYVIMMAHGSVLPPGADRPYPYVKLEDIDLTGIGILCCGHIHEDLGVTLYDTTWFCNVGAVGRFARTQANMEREVKVLLIEKEKGLPPSFRAITLDSALPASEIFLERESTDGEVPSDDIVKFADSLAEGLSLETLPIDELLAQQAGVGEEVKAEVKKYLEMGGL